MVSVKTRRWSQTQGGVDNWINNHGRLGQTVSFSSYTSTSTCISVASRMSNEGILFEILTPEGVNITSVSEYTSEREVLLPRNQTYAVVGHKTIVDEYYPECNVQVVQLVAINSKGEVLDGTNADEPPSIDSILEENKKRLEAKKDEPKEETGPEESESEDSWSYSGLEY